jgi:uncharacterized protein involved in outer membrane biogenesis
MKVLKLATFAVLFLLALGLLARNQLIKMEARRLLAEQTGFGLEIGHLKTHVWASRAELFDVVVRNPPEYPEPTAFVIRRAFIDIDPWALLRRETHLRVVELEVPRVVIVRNRDGEMNLQRLSGRSARGTAAPSKPDPRPGAPERPSGGQATPESGEAGRPRPPERPFRIDRLRIRVDAVEYHDFKGDRAEPDVTKLDLKIDREHTDVTSVRQIGELIATGVLESAADRLMGDLGRSIQRVVEDEKLRDELRKFGRDLKRIFKGMVESPPE